MNFCDEELMAMVSTGSMEALDMLYERYKQRIFNFARSCLKNTEDAEDVVQEVFIRICKSARTYQPQGRFKSWIFQISANQIRTLASAKFTDDRYDADPPPLPDNRHPERSLLARDMLHCLLSSLTPIQRMIVILKEVEGMDAPSISSILNLSPENMRVQLHRARNRMLKITKGEMKDGGHKTRPRKARPNEEANR